MTIPYHVWNNLPISTRIMAMYNARIQRPLQYPLLAPQVAPPVSPPVALPPTPPPTPTQNVPPRNVIVHLKYTKAHQFTVYLLNADNHTDLLGYYTFDAIGKTGCIVLRRDANRNLVDYKSLPTKKYSDVAFRLVGSIFSKQDFIVKKLVLSLYGYQGNVDFGTKVEHLKELYLIDCRGERKMGRIRNNFRRAPDILFVDTEKITLDKMDLTHLENAFGDVRELYIEMRRFFTRTEFPFFGNPLLRHHDGSLTTTGFYKLINLIHERPLPADDKAIRIFLLNTNLNEHLQLSNDKISTKLYFSPNYSHINDVIVSFLTNKTFGKVNNTWTHV